jgi:cell wall-associated NlpC family hydrolase
MSALAFDTRRNRAALLVVIAVCTAACATTGSNKPKPRPFPGAPLPPAEAPPSPVGPPIVPPAPPTSSEIVETALMLRGTPYRNGGTDPSGFDCSGFVQWVYAQHGVHLPRDVEMQFTGAGKKIDVSDLHPGDLIFFHTEGNGASHVGLAIGGDEFVHAPSSRGVVRVERFTTNYWRHRIVGARRIGDLGTKELGDEGNH